MENSVALKGRQRIYHLDVVRVVAIISISLNHAVNRTYANKEGQAAEFLTIPLVSTVFKAFMAVFSRIGVPLFLMITGAIILNKKIEDAADVKRFYRHNLLDMLITAEIWYFIMYWAMALMSTEAPINSLGEAVWGMVKTMLFLDQRTLGSMWYMPMILCVYTTLPFAAMLVKKLPIKALMLPIALVFVHSMLVPAINNALLLNGQTAMQSAIREADICSMYYIYIFAGYFVNNGGLRRLRTGVVAMITVAVYLVCCLYQLYAYKQPMDYQVYYDFPLLPLCAMGLFEMIRRGAGKIKGLAPGITYLSKISFGVYFVHIMLMEALDHFMSFRGWYRPVKMLFLELVCVGGSIVLITITAKIPLCKKRFFNIKD